MTATKPIDVVVAGHLCLDLSPGFADHGSQTLKDILVPGRLVNVGPAALSKPARGFQYRASTLRMLCSKTCLMARSGRCARTECPPHPRRLRGLGQPDRRLKGGYRLFGGDRAAWHRPHLPAPSRRQRYVHKRRPRPGQALILPAVPLRLSAPDAAHVQRRRA